MNMSEAPLQNAPLIGTLLGADPETISSELRNEGNQLRVSGNFDLANFLDDAFLKRERCIFGFPVQK